MFAAYAHTMFSAQLDGDIGHESNTVCANVQRHKHAYRHEEVHELSRAWSREAGLSSKRKSLPGLM